VETFYRVFNSFNQYSYVIFSICGLLLVILILRRRGVRREIIAGLSIAFAAIAITGFIVLRPGEGDVRELRDAQAMLVNGRPTFVEFFSNYCAGCLSLRPVVDQIVADVNETHNILRIDIHSEVGRELRERLGFSFTPEFVLYDIGGIEIWRSHLPPTPFDLERALNAPEEI
jgi:thiol-disulfide isomerase/thioredoxin